MNFNITRFITLARRDFIIYRKPLLYGLLLIPLSVFMISYLKGLSEGVLDATFLLNWIAVFLFVGGIAFTSTVFWEFKSTPERAQYLTLPASNFEKLLSRWIYSLVLYPIFICLVFWILIKANGTGFNDQNKEILGIFGNVYILGHSIFFMFAIWFNKYVAPKSILTIWLVFFVLVLIISLLFRLVFMDVFDGFSIQFNETVKIDPKNENFPAWVEHNVCPLLKIFVWYILPIFFWVVAYFKMQEKEA